MTRIALPDPTLPAGCPLPTDDLPGFLAWHRDRFGDALMVDGDGDGDGDGDTGGDGDGDDDGDDGDPDGDGDGDGDGDDDLTRTRRALERERELRKTERKARRDAERKLAERDKPKPKPKAGGGTGGTGGTGGDRDDAPDADELREQVRREVQAEVRLERAGDRVVALAADVLADPADARLFLDLDDLADDAGQVDPEDVQTALAELLDRKPHLRKSGRRRFGGGADGGADRGGSGGGKQREVRPGVDRLRQAYEDSSKSRTRNRT